MKERPDRLMVVTWEITSTRADEGVWADISVTIGILSHTWMDLVFDIRYTDKVRLVRIPKEVI